MEEYALRLPIKLGQFLKVTAMVENGAHAKELISAGCVYVNNEVELRRAHELHENDVVTIVDDYNEPITIRVVSR